MRHKSLFCIVFLWAFLYSTKGDCQVSSGKLDTPSLRRPITISLIDSLNKTAFSIFRTDPNKAKKLALAALQYSKQLNYPTGEGKASNYLGITEHIAGEYDSAAAYYKHAIEVFQTLRDTQYLGKIYNNMAYLYTDQEYMNLALEYNLKSFAIAEALKDTASILDSYNNIGLFYESIEKYDKALEYFNKMVELTESKKELAESYYSALANIALIDIFQNNFKNASALLKDVLTYSRSVQDNYSIAQTYNSLGLMYLKTNHADSALIAFAESDRYAAILEDKKTMAGNGQKVGELYFQQKQYEKARDQFEKTFVLAHENSFLKIEMEISFYLSKIDSVNRDFFPALQKYQTGVTLRDSLNSISLKKQIAEMSIKYESIKKDQEISMLKKNKEIQDLGMKKQVTQKKLLLIILLIVIGFFSLAFYSRRQIAIKNAILLKHEEQLEEMVAERTAELLAAKEKAEESDRLKSAFLANMSHEIRTPLNGIMGFMDLLEDKNVSKEDQESYFEIIRKSSDRLLYTINNIIDFSKIESRQMKVHFSEFDFSERAIFLVDFFTPEAIRKGLQFEFRKDQQIGSAIIWSDKDKLDAIMTNLIKNAIKYTNQGFIEFGYHFEEGQLILYVKDTGYGIPPERLQSIFDRFTQLHGGLKESFEGSGLGLAISKGYIDLLGGTITVESEVDKGSIFRVNVPVSLKNS